MIVLHDASVVSVTSLAPSQPADSFSHVCSDDSSGYKNISLSVATLLLSSLLFPSRGSGRAAVSKHGPGFLRAHSKAASTFAIGLGLWFARKLGLGAPVLEAWLYGHTYPVPPRMVAISCLTGIGLGAITLLLLHSPMGAPLTSLPVATEGAMPLWKRFLACFYGGLCEEMLMRLFFLSFLLWLFGKCARRSDPARSLVIFWMANLVAALAFGAGHLPLAAHLVPLTASVVVAVISLNAFVALGFGYLYWTRGLEAAILAHFAADLVLHVVGPIF